MQISRVVKFIRKGEKGDGVVSTEIRYVISLNGTTPPLDQSNWTESIPTLIKGRYLWTRTILTYSDGSKSYSYTVSYIAKDGEKGEKGKDGKDGANYLPPVWWDSEVKYVNSGFGIPVVKLEDGTTLGYSVYALTADESPAGYTPSGYPEIWRLMESSEYMFLQEAYIEKLQAELVTAEKIQSLVIETGNLKVKEGAEIAAFDVVGTSIISKAKDSQGNPLVVIDGDGSETIITGTFLSNSNGSKIKIDPVNRCIRLLTSTNQVIGEWWFNDSSPYDIASTLDLHHYYNNVRTSTLRLGGVGSSMSIITYNASGSITGRAVFDYNGYRKLI